MYNPDFCYINRSEEGSPAASLLDAPHPGYTVLTLWIFTTRTAMRADPAVLYPHKTPARGPQSNLLDKSDSICAFGLRRLRNATLHISQQQNAVQGAKARRCAFAFISLFLFFFFYHRTN